MPSKSRSGCTSEGRAPDPYERRGALGSRVLGGQPKADQSRDAVDFARRDGFPSGRSMVSLGWWGRRSATLSAEGFPPDRALERQ